MLKVAEQGDFWAGDKLELNLTFDTLKDYQWDRLMKALWSYPAVAGPFEDRCFPGQPEQPKIDIKKAEPTATYGEFGTFEFAPGVKAGIEVLVTRSLFECVSILVPLNMFDGVNAEPGNEGLQVLEKAFYDLAVKLYETTTYSIGTIGVNRGCTLLMEMITDNAVREEFIKTGNFLARDDSLAALRLQPRLYKEVMPALRWSPPSNKLSPEMSTSQ
jgi:hypothetical protein